MSSRWQNDWTETHEMVFSRFRRPLFVLCTEGIRERISDTTLRKCMQGELTPTSTQSAEHYMWGEVCDGWHLLKRDDISVIQERVPPGQSERTHFHKISRQFFFILDGEATIVTTSKTIALTKYQGVEIPPGVPHQVCNKSPEDVVFLVISFPKSHGDRYY